MPSSRSLSLKVSVPFNLWASRKRDSHSQALYELFHYNIIRVKFAADTFVVVVFVVVVVVIVVAAVSVFFFRYRQLLWRKLMLHLISPMFFWTRRL